MKYFKFLFLFFLITFISVNLLAQNNDVTLKWDDSRTVLIHIGEESFPMQADGERVISLPIDDALVIKIETPQNSYSAESFLLIDERSNAALTIWLSGSTVQFEYGTEGEITGKNTPITSETVTNRNNSSPNLQSNSEPRAKRNVVHSDWSLLLYETDPGVGINLSALDIGYFTNMKEYRLDNSSIFHGMAIDMNFGFYNLEEGSFSFNSLHYDLGLGYGAVFNDNILTAATINLPIYYSTWSSFNTGTSLETTDNTQWFVTDAAYMRLHSSWSPFIDSGGWYRGLSFNTSWDVALSGDNVSQFNIGIGISDFRMR